MSRPRKCALCTGDPVITGQVNAMLEARVKLQAISGEYPQFSTSQLSRHRNRCLEKLTTDLPANVGSDEIRLWLRRAESCYLTAQSLGDAKSAVSACSMAVRGLTQLARQLEREREREKAIGLPGQTPLSIEALDELVDAYVAKTKTETTCPFCGAPKIPEETHNANVSTN